MRPPLLGPPLSLPEDSWLVGWPTGERDKLGYSVMIIVMNGKNARNSNSNINSSSFF